MSRQHHNPNAYGKDILRNILRGKKRFLAIAVITALGVMMFSGLQAACEDLRRSADVFFDAQNLHDLAVVSTLGLTDEDVEVLQETEGILLAEGSYSEDVDIETDSGSFSVELQVLSEAGMDVPSVVEGRMPESVGETVITQLFASDTGLGVGDTFTVLIGEDEEEDEEDADGEDSEEESGDVQDGDSDAQDESAGETEDDDADEDDDDDDISLDFELEDDTDSSYVVQTEYTITGIVIDVTDVDNPLETSSFRTVTTANARFFVLPEAVDNEIYTAVYLIVDGAAQLWCYSDAYEDLIDGIREMIQEDVKPVREEARTASVVGDAQAELDDAREEAEEALADALAELEDGEEELNTELADALAELEDGEQEIADGWAEIEDAKAELEDAKQELEDGKAELEDGKAELADARQQIEDALAELDAQEASALEQIEEGRSQIVEGRSQLNTSITYYSGIDTLLGSVQSAMDAAMQAAVSTENLFTYAVSLLGEEQQAALQEMGVTSAETLVSKRYEVQQTIVALQEQLAALDDSEAELDAEEASALAQIEEGRAQIEENLKTIEESEAELADAEAELADGEQEIADAEAEIADAEAELADAEQELADGWEEYYDGKEEGESELADGWEDYYEAKAEVEEKLADAQAEIDDIGEAVWYVQDRSSLNGYANIDSDSDSIQAIATVFPAVFLAVAILISLTTVSRMVDEDRGLFGTYKSLGFTDEEIRRKYLVYSALACIFGSALGTILAFVGLPEFVFIIFSVMYILPEYSLWFLPARAALGTVLFLAGVLAATWRACWKQLSKTPAALMRPKSPRQGSRVFLERIPLIWDHLSFLNKVTARNIFRYKGRMLMTIFGVGGCMALLLFGFAIKDSVTDLMPRQYEQTIFYDILAVGTADDNDLLLSYMEDDGDVESYINAGVSSVTLSYGTDEASAEELSGIQLIVVPEGEDISSYINLEDAISGEPLTLEDGDIYITRNAADVLGFDAGDTVTMQLLDLQEAEFTVTALTANYMSNYVYMNEATYESWYDEFEADSLLIHLKDSCEDPIAYGEAMEKKEGVVSCISWAEMIEDFSDAFLLINMVVYILIVMSAALAFTVLFTLSATNISEREREIATIKVLGFYDNEVHAYINKETLLLTGIGILAGIPLGYAFAQTLTVILRLPSLYLAVSLHGISYVYSAGLTVIFAAIVTIMSNRSLNTVDPATALKSVE